MDRNADLSKSIVAQHMKSDGPLDSKGKRLLSDLGRKHKLAGAAAQVVDPDDAAEEPVKKGNPKNPSVKCCPKCSGPCQQRQSRTMSL